MNSNGRGRRRRQVYVGPGVLLLLVVIVVAVLAGVFLWGRGGEETPGNDSAQVSGQDDQQTDGTGNSQTDDQQTDADEPKGVVTSTGVNCTLMDLGENAIYTGDLILVNNSTFFHFPENQELVSVYDEKNDSYYVGGTNIYLAPAAMEALNAMLADFTAQGGSKSVNVVAGHRTEEFQQHLFDQSAEQNGLEHAQQYVAQPGGSEHHTGYALDLSVYHSDGTSEEYDGTGEYAWINENCQNYGLVVRYATDKADITGIANEPWHFRYVGIPHATQMVKEGLCLEEYISGTYEVWYAEGSAIYLPDSGEYTVSGNNVDGVIVTCKVG